jgi:hypothetical protein
LAATLDHDCFPQPLDSAALLWRYLSLERFHDMLKTSALFFSRADLLGDPFEGSVPSRNIALRRKRWGRWNPIVRELALYYTLGRRWMYVNCWHMAAHESTAMWEIYGRGGPAIAVRTRYNKLAAVLPDSVLLGMVRYVDYQRGLIPEDNMLRALMSKRLEYRHEQEVRAVLWHLPDAPKGADISKIVTPPGMRVGVNLADMIEAVVLSPKADKHDREAVSTSLRHHGIYADVGISALGGSPTF